jgi:hypothetical protein
MPFVAIASIPDPDRTVALLAYASWGQVVLVTVPFGSDFNQNAELALDWRPLESSQWITGTQVSRGSGFYTATLPLTWSFGYELRATFTIGFGSIRRTAFESLQSSARATRKRSFYC